MKNFFKSSFAKIWLPVLILFFIFSYSSFSITSIFIEPIPEKKLTIATGRESGNYYKTALKYKKLLKDEGVELVVIPTAGSVEALEFIKSKKVDIAFIQGGVIEDEDKKGLEALASIYYEPIWIFYNKKKFDLEYISDLQNRKISVGESGSGTKPVALNLLNVNKIDTNNSSNLSYLSTVKSKEALFNGEIDAFFVITSPKSTTIKEMLLNPDIGVVNFKRAKAYSKRYKFISDVTLHEGTVYLNKNLPSSDIKLLATTASLVVREDIRHELIRIFMKKIKIVHKEESILEEADEFPSKKYLELPINEDASRYLKNGDSWLEGIFPFWIASNIDRLKILIIPLLTLLIPLLKGAIPLYRWSVRYKIYRWYDELNNLDVKLDNLNQDELNDEYLKLKELSKEINESTKVPLSYMGEYYNLKLHFRLIMDRVEKKF